MKITPLQQYLIIGALIFAGILFGYYQYLWKPVNEQIRQLTATRDQKKKDLEEAKKIVAKYVEFKKQAATVQRELEWYQNRVPKKLEVPRLIDALHEVAGLIYNRVSFADMKGKDAYIELPADVQFSSSYQGVLDYLYGLSVASIFLIPCNLDLRYFQNPTNPDNMIQVRMLVKGVAAK